MRGEIAFTSRHPIVDTGGITRPGVIPYINDPQATLRWAKDNGARYFISSHAPEPGAAAVFATTLPFLAGPSVVHNMKRRSPSRCISFRNRSVTLARHSPGERDPDLESASASVGSG